MTFREFLNEGKLNGRSTNPDEDVIGTSFREFLLEKAEVIKTWVSNGRKIDLMDFSKQISDFKKSREYGYGSIYLIDNYGKEPSTKNLKMGLYDDEIRFDVPKNSLGVEKVGEFNRYGQKYSVDEIMDEIKLYSAGAVKMLKTLNKTGEVSFESYVFISSYDIDSKRGPYRHTGGNYIKGEKFKLSEKAKYKKLIEKIRNDKQSVTVKTVTLMYGEFTRIESTEEKMLQSGGFANIDDLVSSTINIMKTFKYFTDKAISVTRDSTSVKIKLINFSATSNTSSNGEVVVNLDVKDENKLTSLLKPVKEHFVKYYNAEVSYADSFRKHIQSTGGHRGNPVYMD